MFWFTSRYRIKGNIKPALKKINEPYLLLGNHYGRFDPFIMSYFFDKRPNFVSSDAILRDKVIGSLFKGLGAMPMKKGLRDSSIIRQMLKVIQADGALAIFPEGTRTWNGVTGRMDPSIAKLVRLLKVPVITARMRGAYLMDPRWAKPIRRAQMEIDFQQIIGKEETRELSEDEIFNRIKESIYQDDTAYQEEKKIEIKSSKRAESVDLVLFQCQCCSEFSQFSSIGNEFNCTSCTQRFEFDKYGFIKSNIELKFNNLRDWINWQNNNFVVFIKEEYAIGREESFFSAPSMSIESAIGYKRMEKLGIGDISFFGDRIEVLLPEEKIVLEIDKISSMSAQYMERVELIYGDIAYRFVSKKHNESGLKWELATNVIWSLAGAEQKVASYFRDIV